MTHQAIEQALHPLPLAEDVGCDLLQAYGVRIKGRWQRSGSPEWQFRYAWNNLEYALASHEEVYADEAFRELNDLAGGPDTPSTARLTVGARSALAYEKAFRLRVRSLPLAQEVTHTYQALMPVTNDMRRSAHIPESYQEGLLAEHIALGALLRMGVRRGFPFIASPREEANLLNSRDNHDVYLLRGATGAHYKEPARVRKKWNSTHGGSTVTPVYVLLLVDRAIAELHPDMYAHFDTMEKRAGENARLDYVAELMVRESAGGNDLSEQDSKVLHYLSLAVRGRIHRGLLRKNGAIGAALP